MRFEDLRPQRKKRELLVKVRLERVDLHEAVREAVRAQLGRRVAGELLDKGLEIEPRRCYLAWVGERWQQAEHVKRGASREEALQYLYTDLMSALQRLGSVSKEALEGRRLTINTAIRRAKKASPEQLAAALEDADRWTLSKYARRVARQVWELVLDVRATKKTEAGPRVTRRIWAPGTDKFESEEKPLPDFEQTPVAGWAAVLTGRTSSGTLEPIGRASLGIDIQRPDARTAVVALDGFIDNATVRQLDEALRGLDRAGVQAVVFDLRRLTYVNSTGLGSFVKFRGLFQGKGGEVVLTGVHMKLMIVLEMLGLDIVFELAPTPQAGLEALRG